MFIYAQPNARRQPLPLKERIEWFIVVIWSIVLYAGMFGCTDICRYSVWTSGTIGLLGERICHCNTEWQQVFVDGWPHIVLTTIPGVAIEPGQQSV